MIKFLIILLLSCDLVVSDIYLPPTDIGAISTRGIYSVRVTPAVHDGLKKPCFAEVYKFEENSNAFFSVKKIKLKNKTCPRTVLISDDGQFLVTLDEYGRAGYGKLAVVVYNLKNDEIKQFGLSDFMTEMDIKCTKHSVSSIWWNEGGEIYGDEVFIESQESNYIIPEEYKYKKIKYFILNLGTMKFDVIREH